MSGNSYTGGQLPVVAIGSDIVEIFLGEQGGKFFGKRSTNSDDQGVLRIDQTITHQGGEIGSTIPTFQTSTFIVGAGGPLNNYVWAVRHQLKSKAFGPGQHVGLSSTVRRPADALVDGKGPRSPIWPLCLELRDLTEKPANIAGPLIVAEWDMMGNGGDPNNQRIIHHMILQKHNPDGAAMRVGAGSVIGSNDTGPIQASSFLGVGYQVQVPIDRAAFDASSATTLPGAAAFKMREGQIMTLDGDPGAGFNRCLGAAGGRLFYCVVGKDVFKISDTGQVMAQGGIVEPIGKTPASSRAPCVTGERAWDEWFEYRCIAPNRWRRAELVDW